ncbi:MAG: glycosyltransferase [Gammaproteobacteria bacterium]|nr:glycosyltransferase [Gammaproteobacteria bacterium]
MLPELAITGATVIWLAVLILPWQPWRTREQFTPEADRRRSLDTVTVVIPARNEADVIAGTLAALKQQDPDLRIILVDDQSTDATADRAREHGTSRLQILSAPPLPAGWSGKLWALEQGFRRVQTDYTLLLDADIELQAGVIAGLLDKLERENLQMISLMARLRMVSGWEKLLMPAFIYFFKLLYPFALANHPDSRVAAAAGGCILIRTRAFAAVGGPAGLRTALIDDCALARRVKHNGGRIWLGLTHAAISRRRYENLATIWEMVTRTAYTQLHYSPWLLTACILLLLETYAVPVAGLFYPGSARWLAVLAVLGMCGSYLPTLRYYGLPGWRVLILPVAAMLFGLMTLDSARRHLAGHGARWKNRTYTGT